MKKLFKIFLSMLSILVVFLLLALCTSCANKWGNCPTYGKINQYDKTTF